ncbi:MAG: FHA domain-containing protein [Acidobacteriota bacterium]|nr:FHA domain-containing protein [Acidobacteriota bacterium]
MTVDIEMLRDGTRWTLDQREVTLGRDPDSDVRLTADEFLMVSRRHAIVRTVGEGDVWLEDQNSFNGTLLNGRRISNERLNSGDLIRLGDDGPEFRVTFGTGVMLRPGTNPDLRGATAAGSNTPPLGSYSAPTAFSAGAARTPPPTQYGGGGVGSSGTGATKEPPPTSYGGRPGTGGFATTSRTPAPPQIPTHEVPTHMAGTSGGLQAPALSASAQMPAATYDELSPGEEAMLESKIAMTRNLLLLVILLCIALGAVVIIQGQEIRKTRETLNAMQRQAENAVGQFMPQLNNRLNRFDSRLDDFQGKMDQMDANMKRAEDRFVVRMNTEMPKIMDRYVQMKANEIQRSTKGQVQIR